MGNNRASIEEFWSLPTDEQMSLTADPDAMLKYMREVQAAYDKSGVHNQPIINNN